MNDDAEQYRASNFLKKKDDANQYHASNFVKKSKSKSKTGLLERAANDVEQYINKPIEEVGRGARDLIGGFGQGLGNIAPGLANLGASGINALGGNVGKVPMFDVVPDTPSKTAGEIASFFAGPGFLKALTKAPEAIAFGNSAMKIPQIANSIKHASNILGKSPMASRIAGNALLGGAYNPENPGIGMALGAGGGILGEGVSKGYSGIKNSLKSNEFLQRNLAKINPEAQAKDLEHYLSGGTNNLTQNTKELVKDIRTAYKSREDEAGTFFNYALEKAGNQKIYKENPMILNKIDESIDTLGKIKDLNVGDLYHSFKANPTFNNAHKLQSELGSMERQLKANPLKTQDDINQISKISSARKKLQSDISRFLERHDQTSNNPIGEKYKMGSDLFREHVAPYLEDKKILDIVRGGKTDIKNLHNAFNTPTNLIGKGGEEQIGAINKILQDLPEDSKKRILFNAIGGNKLSPEKLLEKMEEVKSKGYSSYFTPEVEESVNALNQKIKNKNRTKIGLGLVALKGAAKNALSHVL